MNLLYKTSIFILISILEVSETVSPKGTVQYVFNVPTDLEGDYPRELQAAMANLQEQMTVLSQRLRYLESNGAVELLNITSSGKQNLFGIGTNYVRWGRKTCPADNMLIYTGYAAKTYHGHVGGGIDFLCLPNNPQFSSKAVSGHQGNNYIYGVQVYAKNVNGILDSKFNYHDMACSRCEAPLRTQTIMIPGNTSCPNNWHLEYEGYIMSAHYTHQSPSTYICVDKDQEFTNGGKSDQSSGYVYPVEIVCGSIPCPPYKQGLELSCVVCSK